MAKNIRKAVLLLAMLSVIVGMFTACGNKKSDDGRTTFTVGFDAEFPPYGYKDDSGEYVGFDLDLAQEVCERNCPESFRKTRVRTRTVWKTLY